MEVLKVKRGSIKDAVHILRAGGVVVFPTETAYGIGCDATNKDAVKRVFEIKGRPKDKGVPIIVDSIKRAAVYVDFSDRATALAKKHWPGPLNLVLPLREDCKLVNQVTQGDTSAVRVSSHKVAYKLAKRLGKPIVATSANVSGEETCYSIPCLLDQFKFEEDSPLPDIILDAGVLPRQKTSTVAHVIGDQVIVLRQGKIRV